METNLWEKYKENCEELEKFCEGYKKFISECKTERECIREGILEAEKHGFRSLE